MLNDGEFLRYSRQLLLEDIGPEGQLRLKQSTVLIVGLGGLGSPVALYLAAAGVGNLILADDDKLHLTNLQRQILFRTDDIQRSKAELAKEQLQALNPEVNYQVLNERITADNLTEILQKTNLVLDCCDNMATRHAVNAACVKHKVTLVSGSAVSFSGQLMVLNPPFAHGCYACLYPQQQEPELNCRTAGVLGPLVGAIGSLQALEAVKILSGVPSALSGKLQLFDGKKHRWNTLALSRDPACAVCGKQGGQNANLG